MTIPTYLATYLQSDKPSGYYIPTHFYGIRVPDLIRNKLSKFFKVFFGRITILSLYNYYCTYPMVKEQRLGWLRLVYTICCKGIGLNCRGTFAEKIPAIILKRTDLCNCLSSDNFFYTGGLFRTKKNQSDSVPWGLFVYAIENQETGSASFSVPCRLLQDVWLLVGKY